MTVNFWEAVSAASGVIYFAAWSASFYPQLILNYKRKSALGLSPDFMLVNPIGFLCLTVYSWSLYFSPTARRQYQERFGGQPQVSKSDLAFALHALILSTATFVQGAWYLFRARQARNKPGPRETHPLLRRSSEPDLSAAPTAPSLATRVGLAAMTVATLWEITSLAMGRIMFLDFLYFASSIKLLITIFKYVPQVYLNYKLKSVRGFAIATIFMDLTGGVLSLAQLCISSIFIAHQPSGIWANPGKLGLSILTLVFDLTFIFQRYVLYPEEPEVDEDAF